MVLVIHAKRKPHGDVPMTFNVSDKCETISVDGNIDVTPVNDAPDAPTIQMQGDK
ncbi:cadherin-like domain-containing protein [Vibrio chagasii]|nr:cadherin-like domain-containing protein [Vibrio chagasii]